MTPSVLHAKKRFEGAWLYNDQVGIGIHLIRGQPIRRSLDVAAINPKDDHLSFVAESLDAVEAEFKVRTQLA